MLYGFLSLLPYGIILTAMVIMGFVTLLTQVPGPVATELVIAVGAITLFVMGVFVIVTTFCVTIRPIEEFVGDATEARICALIKRTDEFIANDVGIDGIDNPGLVSAKRAKLAAAAEPLLMCDASPTMNVYYRKKNQLTKTSICPGWNGHSWALCIRRLPKPVRLRPVTSHVRH